MTSSDQILGEIPAVAKLTSGFEHLTLFVTSSSLIVAHGGKRGGGVAVSANVLGKLGGALGDFLKSGKESVDKRRISNLRPREILAANKNNFSIGFDEIIKVTVNQGARLTGLTILTGNDKFEFTTRLGFDKVVELLGKVLGSKLTSHGLA
jgi:hypothetical protein